MARPLRIHIPGMVYHVMSRGNGKQAIFHVDADYTHYLRLLKRALARFRVRCHAYCLLRNHLHLLLRPDEVPLARMMQQLSSAYCQWFNRRQKTVGHVFQGRYKACLVDSDVYFLNVLRYIARNPVEAECVKHPAEWRWSSYRATVGRTGVPSWLDVTPVWTAFDADDAATGQERFATFVGSGDDDVPREGLLIGSRAFLEQCAPILRPYQDVADYALCERFAARPPLSDLLPADRGELLDRAVYQAFCEYAYTLREIGAHVGRPIQTIWSWIQRAEYARATEEPCRMEQIEGIRK